MTAPDIIRGAESCDCDHVGKWSSCSFQCTTPLCTPLAFEFFRIEAKIWNTVVLKKQPHPSWIRSACDSCKDKTYTKKVSSRQVMECWLWLRWSLEVKWLSFAENVSSPHTAEVDPAVKCKCWISVYFLVLAQSALCNPFMLANQISSTLKAPSMTQMQP